MMCGSRFKAWLAVAVIVVVMALAMPVNAAKHDVPAAITKVIGLYEGASDKFLLRENDGHVEMVYDMGDRNSAPFSLYAVFPLQVIAADEYQLIIASPLRKATGKVYIERDASGFGNVCLVGPDAYNRRFFDPELGKTYRLKAQYSLEELRRLAATASPPPEQGTFLHPDLINVATLDSSIHLDIRYATDNNFIGAPLYDRPRAYLQRPAAEALVRVHKKLVSHGYGLIIHDAYRPWAVTKMFWDATPEAQKMFVADPAKGSRHNRGGAVDLSLYDLSTGRPIAMISGYDEFSLRAHPGYPGGTALERGRRDLLRIYMEAEGFTVYEEEWWHFDYKDWRSYPIMNLSFAELDDASGR
ncbi:M15 family metallopeptidase [Anaeroselena agilis]|uniref:D-alanyl-D-alanine dipeptidase n=1 Tax=Anaeroselena agilis TaxID=3063788 RepID=A0ABU3P325_9FIRM|nr:M15 family metallopeptidase [Selenomonadales bacterium 4137-cl]